MVQYSRRDDNRDWRGGYRRSATDNQRNELAAFGQRHGHCDGLSPGRREWRLGVELEQFEALHPREREDELWFVEHVELVNAHDVVDCAVRNVVRARRQFHRASAA